MRLRHIFYICSLQRLLLVLVLANDGTTTQVVEEVDDPNTHGIIGGKIVKDETSYPYFAQIGSCGASLIHDDLLLTAAHCKIKKDWERAWLGSTQFEKGLVRFITGSVIHPLYNYGKGFYDYQVLKLSTSAFKRTEGDPSENITIEKITLNRQNDIPITGQTLVVMGFGATTVDSYERPNQMHEVNVTAIDNDNCVRYYGALSIDPTIMICAGDEKNGGKGMSDTFSFLFGAIFPSSLESPFIYP